MWDNTKIAETKIHWKPKLNSLEYTRISKSHSEQNKKKHQPQSTAHLYLLQICQHWHQQDVILHPSTKPIRTVNSVPCKAPKKKTQPNHTNVTMYFGSVYITKMIGLLYKYSIYNKVTWSLQSFYVSDFLCLSALKVLFKFFKYNWIHI